jgi:hypothetical protein
MLGAMGRPRWTQPELASAAPEVVAAARWELFAYRLWPAETAAILASPDDPTPSQVKHMKLQSRMELARLRALLLPADEEPD